MYLHDIIMRSAFSDLMPPQLRRALKKLGADLAIARRKRKFTMAMMAERVGVARTTYLKLEQGDPSVSMGAYAMALFMLGFPDVLRDVADMRRDATGLLLDAERLPKRVRLRRSEPAAS